MSLVMNGTIIPEDTANALTFNGTDITAVFMNGTQVWKQQLFSATWSGGDSYSISGVYGGGLSTSGSNYRNIHSRFVGVVGYGSTWYTSTSTDAFPYSAINDSNNIGTERLGVNTFRSAGTVNALSFDKSSGFTGATEGSELSRFRYETSGGLLRATYASNFTNKNVGVWLSLT